MHVQIMHPLGNRDRVSGFLRLFVFSLLAAAFACTTLHAQTVAYVTNFRGNTVSVIDTSTNTVTATIAVGNGPDGVVFSPDDSRVYITNLAGSSISVIDTVSQTVVATIPLGALLLPGPVAITPDGKTLYLTDSSNGDVEVVSTVTNTLIATVPGGGFGGIAITPNGAFVYAQSFGLTSAIGTANNSIVATIPTAAGNSLQTAITPDGAFVYAPESASDLVAVIATATNAVVANVPTGSMTSPTGVAITPDGAFAYVALSNSGAVSVIQTSNNTVAATIPVGAGPSELAITPDGSFVYVTNGADNTVSVISTATNTVVGAPIAVGSIPVGIAIANLSSPFAAFTIDNLAINDNLHEQGDFTLGANTGGIDLAHQPVTITVNNFSLTIPAGSFKQVGGNMHFVFNGTVNGLKVNFNIQAKHGSSTQFDFVFDVHGVSISGPNPANVSLGIGSNTGTTTAPF